MRSIPFQITIIQTMESLRKKMEAFRVRGETSQGVSTESKKTDEELEAERRAEYAEYKKEWKEREKKAAAQEEEFVERTLHFWSVLARMKPENKWYSEIGMPQLFEMLEMEKMRDEYIEDMMRPDTSSEEEEDGADGAEGGTTLSRYEQFKKDEKVREQKRREQEEAVPVVYAQFESKPCLIQIAMEKNCRHLGGTGDCVKNYL